MHSHYVKAECDVVSTYCGPLAKKSPTHKEFFGEAARFLEACKCYTPSVGLALTPHLTHQWDYIQINSHVSKFFVDEVLNVLELESKLGSHSSSKLQDIRSLRTIVKEFDEFMNKVFIELNGERHQQWEGLRQEVQNNDRAVDVIKISKTVEHIVQMI